MLLCACGWAPQGTPARAKLDAERYRKWDAARLAATPGLAALEASNRKFISDYSPLKTGHYYSDIFGQRYWAPEPEITLHIINH